MTAGIYIITTPSINNRCYIGSAKNLDTRWKLHINHLKSKRHCNGHLQNTSNKYGIEVFVFAVLLLCDSKDLLFYEQRALDVYNPEYNICKIAGSKLGIKHTKKTKRLISLHGKGKGGGWHHSEKIKAIISAKKLGVLKSEETKLKMSKPKSEQTKAKMKAAQLLRRLNEKL